MILLTGGAGFVGLNVAEQLLARGEEVVSFDLSIENGDVTDRDALEKAFSTRKIEQVIHLAAITAGAERDAKEPRRIAEVNLIGTLNVLEAARRHGVKRFVHASTGALYGAAGIGVDEPLDEERHRPVPESMYGITNTPPSAPACAPRSGNGRAHRAPTGLRPLGAATAARDKLSPPTEIARLRSPAAKRCSKLGDTDYIYAPDLASA
jgi:dTDP-D-glucose 4,6-dehydratase